MQGEDMVRPIHVVCFTGHRNIPPADALRLPALLEEHLRILIARGARRFRAGGAIGFDMVASLKLLELRDAEPMLGLQLELILPCRDQTRGWDEPSRRAYQYILEHADRVMYVSERYTSRCMLARDRKLVDGSDVCLAYCTRNRGGAFYTCTYALKQHVELINIGVSGEE